MISKDLSNFRGLIQNFVRFLKRYLSIKFAPGTGATELLLCRRHGSEVFRVRDGMINILKILTDKKIK